MLEQLLENQQPLAIATTEPLEPASVKVEASHIPRRLSASAHQTLINCPYAYFSAEILRLRAPEEIRQILAKNDYGERVHFILYLFHQGGIDSYPPPFPGPVSRHNREQALEHLKRISHAVFQKDLDDNFQHRSWLKRWSDIIPLYIDWLISEPDWRFEAGEINASQPLRNGLEAYGRIDRRDKAREQRRIIDYKTGSFPGEKELLQGEAVQLTHYVLASPEKIDEVGYLSLESKGKPLQTKPPLNGDMLAQLTEAAEQRLMNAQALMERGTPLVAWGDEASCKHCQFKGLCRTRLD